MNTPNPMTSLFIAVLACAACATGSQVSAADSDTPTTQVGYVAEGVSGPSTITLTVTDIRTPQGKLSIGLFSSEEGYNSGNRIGGILADVSSNTVQVEFKNLPEGHYAIRLYHDVDSSSAMNTNIFGLPAEPYAFSNNAKGQMGPAKWNAVNFKVSGANTAHTINLH